MIRFAAVAAFLLSSLPAAALAQVEPDSTLAGSDTLTVDVDTLPPRTGPDTASADTVFFNLPRLGGAVPEGWGTGVWSWDHDAIMASGAVTLAELVAEVPGLVTLLGGDYGTPLALSAFGTGGGGYRVFRDGFEVVPLTGGVADLQRINLAGIHHVRLERNLGEMVIRLRSLEFFDGRPYSLVEAGTGQLDTNFFRGVFGDPVALGGDVALGLERIDTQGPRAEEPGNRYGAWLRYQYHRGDDTGLALDFRRAGTETEVPDYVSPVTRTDWVLRGRHRFGTSWVGEAYSGKSSLAHEDAREDYATLGGAVRQSGLRLGFERHALWATGEVRLLGGKLPSRRLDAAAGFQDGGVGGVTARAQQASWKGRSTRAYGVQAWTRPVLGVSLFGAYESGTYGARRGPLHDLLPPPDTAQAGGDTGEGGGGDVPADSTASPEEAAPLFGVTDRTAWRVGAQLSWRSATVSGTLLSVKADSLLPLGLAMDRDQPVLPGAERTGWEVWGSVPVPIMEGLRLTGSLQRWDGAGPYLPEQVYRGAFVYHKVLKESGTAELWWSLGVRGRDPMRLHAPGTEEIDPESGEPVVTYPMAPFFQSWYARIQIRIVSMRIFITWENFTRRDNLQDFPDRVLPVVRSSYGIRWTLWN